MCQLTQGYVLGACKAGIGGIRNAYICEYKAVAALEMSIANIITGVTNIKPFYKYELQRGTATFKETLNFSQDTGFKYYAQELNIILNRLQTSVRNEILILAKKFIIAIIEDNNGAFWMLGREGGLKLETGESGPGQSGTDRSGYTLNFLGAERTPANEVDPSVIADISGGAVSLFGILTETGENILTEDNQIFLTE